MNTKLKAVLWVIGGPICGLAIAIVLGIGSIFVDCAGCVCAFITCDFNYDPSAVETFMSSLGGTCKFLGVCGLVIGIVVAAALLIQEKRDEEEAARRRRFLAECEQRVRWQKEVMDRARTAERNNSSMKSKAPLRLSAEQHQEADALMNKIETELLKSSELLGPLDVICTDLKKEGDQLK